MVYLSSNSN